jgi:hypothetical protein
MNPVLTDLTPTIGEVVIRIEDEIKPISKSLIQLNGQIRLEAMKMKCILMKHGILDLSKTYEEMKEDKSFMERITNLLSLGLSEILEPTDMGLGLVCEYDLVVNMGGKQFGSMCNDLHIDHVPTRDILKSNRIKLRRKINVLVGLVIFHFDFAETPPTPKPPKVFHIF